MIDEVAALDAELNTWAAARAAPDGVWPHDLRGPDAAAVRAAGVLRETPPGMSLPKMSMRPVLLVREGMS